MIPAGPSLGAKSLIVRFRPTRKTVSLYLPLFVILCGWLLSLLTLGRMKMTASYGLVAVAEYLLVATIVVWGVIFLLLKIQGDGFASIGLSREKLRKSLVPGVLLGVAAAVLEIFVLMPLARRCFPNAQAASLEHWFEGPGVIPLWLFIASLAGLKEESSRSFVLTRFEKAFGKKGLILGLILQTTMFGIGHAYQGKAGAIVAGILGLVYALVYLRRRSCWEAAITHSTYDLILVGIAIYMVSANSPPHH